jgi:hypothetical protein
MQDVSSECLSMVQERMQKNLDGINAVVRSRTLPELMAAQGLLFRENLELTMRNSRRIVELSTRIADTATRTAMARGGMHAG